MKKKINNNKKQNKELYNTLEYKHGNLMTASTIVCLITFMILMLLSTAFKSFNSIMTARTVSAVISGVFLVCFAGMTVLAVKKDRSFWEYSIYSLVMSFGFLSLRGIPFFVPAALYGSKIIQTMFTTKYVQAGLIALNIVYLLGTLIYHTVKSSPKKK